MTAAPSSPSDAPTAPTAAGPSAPAAPRLLGDVLVDRGSLQPEQLVDALRQQRESGRALGRILVESGVITEEELTAALAEQAGFDRVDLLEAPVDPSAASLLNPALARRYRALPIGWDSGRLVLALADPRNVVAIDDIRAITGRNLKIVVATPAALTAAIDRFESVDADAEQISAEAADAFDDNEDLSSIHQVVEDAPIVKLVNLIITEAVNDRASDIHVEPGENDVRVRYRIDGVLHERMRMRKNIQSGVVSRLKIMADMNIAERRLPQDGRVTATIGGRAVDLRVASLPTVYGEKIVLRILDKSTALLRLSDLGFMPASLQAFEAAFKKPYGTVLVTGPTGSGKSTTLYATLNILNEESRNIITVEDPVEYRLAGVNQIQVNARAGMTFASALRSILRADPDVILLGEIRDRETATIAIESALTGHLVLSTLHTNDAASTPSRLVEMGIEPFLVGSALDCIVAQRLARRLCDKCKESYTPNEGEIDALAGGGAHDRILSVDSPVWFRAVGCGACGRTGYRGRFALHEVMTVTEEVERLIVDRAHSEDVKKFAVAQGMLTLRQAGLAQVMAGMTSAEEVLRVVA